MPEVDISFETWKRLTSLLEDENDSYNDVIVRSLAGRDSHPSPIDNDPGNEGAYFKTAFLPNGTQLRATYKGTTYRARIENRQWIDDATGAMRNSPSQAAFEITKSGVNGWLFWMVKRPQDVDWQSLNALRYGTTNL